MQKRLAAQMILGKILSPACLRQTSKCTLMPFDGYWKDVGTIDSLWEANMDLLDPKVPLSLYDPDWKIYARNPALPAPLYCPWSTRAKFNGYGRVRH